MAEHCVSRGWYGNALIGLFVKGLQFTRTGTDQPMPEWKGRLFVIGVGLFFLCAGLFVHQRR